MKYLLRHGSGMYCANTPLLGTGCTSESTHRTAIRSAAGLRSVTVTVIVVSLVSALLACAGSRSLLLLCADAGPDVYAVELRGVSPAELVSLFVGIRSGHL